jgi:multisubunit Na+/H+ antiporter MnhG subunit
MSFVGLLIALSSSMLLVAAAIAFLKAKDVFMMTHVVMIANCYVIPLLLIGVEIERFSWISFAKIIALIVLNLVVTNLLCHAIVRRAVINKIIPDAEEKKFTANLSS